MFGNSTGSRLGSTSSSRMNHSPAPSPTSHAAPRRRLRVPLAGLLGLAAGLAAIGGCTSSARDEYNYVRDLKVAPSAPSEISAIDDRMPVVAQSDFRPRRWAEAIRPGTLSDADTEPR